MLEGLDVETTIALAGLVVAILTLIATVLRNR